MSARAGGGLWRIESRKFDGAAHRFWTCCHPLQPRLWYKGGLAPDLVLHVPPRSPVQEADGRIWSSDYDVFSCFFAARHFQATVLCKRGGVEYYCNVCTVARVDRIRRRVVYVDLELDVKVGAGSVEVVDQDEFEQGAARYGYSALLRERMFADLDRLTREARLRRGVFSPAFVQSVRRLSGKRGRLCAAHDPHSCTGAPILSLRP